MKRYRFLAMACIITLAILTPMITQASTVYACSQGLTPGYWKQPHHLDDWGPTGYSPGDSFDSVFGVVSSYNGTLLEALKRGGGGEKAMMRHAVASLLNAHHPDIDGPSIVALDWWIQYAYDTGDFEGAKDQFEGWNEIDPNFEL